MKHLMAEELCHQMSLTQIKGHAMKSRLKCFLLLAGLELSSFNAECRSQSVAAGVAESSRASADALARDESSVVGRVSEKPLAAFQYELLDLAFQTATAIPIDPHIKDRSRAQEAIVGVCFALDQPRRALEYIEKIDDWRRGAGYADFAFYCAQHGDSSLVQLYLDLANTMSERAEDWRRDRIKVKMARTYAWLGQTQQAAALEAGVTDSESGKVDGVRAMRSDEDVFDQQINVLDGAIATGNFDLVRNALEACAELFDRFYDNEVRRSLAEEKIKTSWNKLPIMIRLELMMKLIQFALDHKDQTNALKLVNDTQVIMDGSQWTPETRVPLMGRLARLRALSGDEEQARAAADAALALFGAERDKIMGIDRAGALRPLAEAYQSMNDLTAALSVYKKAVEEGAENPNARPRAEDLSATCSSMAWRGVEPDAELWTRLRQIQGGLGQPW